MRETEGLDTKTAKPQVTNQAYQLTNLLALGWRGAGTATGPLSLLNQLINQLNCPFRGCAAPAR